MSTTQNAKPAQLQQRLIGFSLKAVVELKDRNALSVSLGTFDIRVPDGVVIEHVTGDCTHAMVLKTGLRLDLHAGAPGKAYLASLPPDELEDVLERMELTRFTDNTFTTREGLLRELARIRRQGYAVDNSEYVTYTGCVGAAILHDLGCDDPDPLSLRIASIFTSGTRFYGAIDSLQVFGSAVARVSDTPTSAAPAGWLVRDRPRQTGGQVGAVRLPETPGATTTRALTYPRRGMPETPETPTSRRYGSAQRALCLGSGRDQCCYCSTKPMVWCQKGTLDEHEKVRVWDPGDVPDRHVRFRLHGTCG